MPSCERKKSSDFPSGCPRSKDRSTIHRSCCDRLKLSFSFLGFALIGGLALLIPVRVFADWHLLFLGFVGLGAVTFGLLAMVPTKLILDPGGLVRRSMFRTIEYPWTDFARFRWYAVRGVLHMVVADRSDESLARLG
jgi:hypothetical protein